MSRTTAHAGSHSIGDDERWHWQRIFLYWRIPHSVFVCVCVCVSFPSLSNELTGHQTKKKERKTAQVPDTFHQQPSIYTLRLLACHSISHSVDYTPRGASGRESHWKSNFVPHQMSGWILQMLRDNHWDGGRRSWGVEEEEEEEEEGWGWRLAEK